MGLQNCGRKCYGHMVSEENNSPCGSQIYRLDDNVQLSSICLFIYDNIVQFICIVMSFQIIFHGHKIFFLPGIFVQVMIDAFFKSIFFIKIKFRAILSIHSLNIHTLPSSLPMTKSITEFNKYFFIINQQSQREKRVRVKSTPLQNFRTAIVCL